MQKIELTSERIKLRLIQLKDLKSIHELHLLPETDEFNTLGIPVRIEETMAIIKPWIEENEKTEIKNFTLAIEKKDTGQFIGLFGLKLWPQKNKRGEIWYKIHSNYWKKGFATEAVNLVLDFGFDMLKLHRIQAGCAVENIGSIKVLEKVGMIKEGRGRQILPLKGGWSDNFEFSILESDSRKKD